MTIHPSPSPPDGGPEIPTGLHPATREYVRTRSRGTNAISIASVVAAMSVVFGAWQAVLAQARQQTDAGMLVVVETQKAHDARLTTLEKRLDRLDTKVDHVSDQNEAVMNALNVPKRLRPAPVPPTRDGGP